MTTDHAPHPTAWLADGPPRRLADRLVAADTHDPATAAMVERELTQFHELVEQVGPGKTAKRLLGPSVDPAARCRHHLILITAATMAQAPLWDPPATAGKRRRRILDPLERCAIRSVARARPDRIAPVALADQGATPAQMAALPPTAFADAGETITVTVPAGQRATVGRTIQLRRWSNQTLRTHLTFCTPRAINPCYRGHHVCPNEIAKAISARIDRVLADTGVHATASSLRYTVGHEALSAGGPPAAMRAIGASSITGALRYLGR